MKPNDRARPYILTILAVALLLGLADRAQAAPLLGHDVGIEYFFPDSASAVESRTVTVGAGVEAPGVIGLFDVDLSDSQIAIDNFEFAGTFVDSAINGTTVTFNGLRFTDRDGTIDPFTNVSIASTNLVGLDPGRLSFDADNIFLDFEGLSFDTSTFVNLDVSSAEVAAVPEPASLTLFGTGALGLWARFRRRTRSTVVAAA